MKAMTRTLLALTLVVMPAGFSHAADEPPKACTQIGCINGVMVQIDDDVKWVPGLYAFQVIMDERTVNCSGFLPLKPCEQGGSVTCEAPGVRIGESGCALPREAHKFSDIHIDGAPKEVAIHLMRVMPEQKPLADHHFTPHYVESQPNGKGCEPICKSFSTTLQFLP